MRIDFNLNRCVPDGEMLMQFMREPNQKLVAGMAARHEAVTRLYQLCSLARYAGHELPSHPAVAEESG